MTDGVQGGLMLLLALAVSVMFVTGFGVDGGFSGMLRALETLDPALTLPLHPTHPVLNSWWDVFAIFIATLPSWLAALIGAGVLAAVMSTADGLVVSTSQIFANDIYRGATKAGALAGFVAGGTLFVILKAGIMPPQWFSGGVFESAGAWLVSQAPNPFACATLGALASLVCVVVVSLFTQPPEEQHLNRVFGN